jgi:acetylornithine deacetylase
MEKYVTAVLQHLDAHQEDLLQFTRDLIATPSLNPPGDEQAIAELVVRHLKDLDLPDAEIMAKIPNRPNVFCRLGGDPDGPTLMLSGHLDTKPVGDRSKWETDPLQGEIINGQLYGLGCGDMKAAVAAMTYAAGAIHATGVPLAGSLLLGFTADEEAGGALGAGYLADEQLVQADAVVLGEPCGVKEEWEYLALISRGTCCFRIEVRGTQMHSSISDILPSVNASAKMAYVLWRMQRDLTSRINYQPHPLCPQGITLNVGVLVEGGVFYGVYPGYAEFACDLRTLPGMTQEGVRQDIEAYLDELRAEDGELEVELEFEPLPLGWIEPCEIPADHPLVRAMQDAAERVFGMSPPLGSIAGTTDAPKFQFGLGMPTIPAFGPGRLPLAHSPNEHIAVDSPFKAAQVYALCALNYLGVK